MHFLQLPRKHLIFVLPAESTIFLPRTHSRSSGLESDWIMVSWERRLPFPTSLVSTLNVPMVQCAINSLEVACSVFQTHLRRLSELSPFTRVKSERKEKRKRWRKKWALGFASTLKVKLSCPSNCPKQEQTILRIVLLLRLLSFGVPSLLVQRKRLFCKIQGEDQVVHTISVNHYKFSSFLVYIRVCDLFLAALVLDINIF